MPERDVNTIREFIHYQYATIIAKSAFAVSDGESRLKLRGDKKDFDAFPPLLPSAAAAIAQAWPTKATWTEGRGENGAGGRCCYWWAMTRTFKIQGLDPTYFPLEGWFG